ncbi:MAG TPA: tetratricopeptide repeat-containing diguanylate cyclase [Rhodanobacteraceae bacterium]|nr:tetratricopeptide repeat-containing diguanylate cyclase [Rhodanobacteraceae bacterium]
MAAESPESLAARAQTLSGREQVDALNDVAKAYWGVSSDKTFDYAEKALTQARSLAYPAGEAAALRNEAIALWYRESYTQALDYVLRAQAIYEKLGDNGGIAGCLSTAGTIYLNLDQFDRAFATYERARVMAVQTGDNNRLGIVLSNLGTTSLGLNKPEQALDYFQRALAILEHDGSELSILTALGNIGGAQRRLGRLDEALATNARIITLAEKIGSKVRLADALTDTGQIFIERKRWDDAEPYLARAVELAHAAGLKRNEREAELQWVRLDEGKGDYQGALGHFYREDALRGDVFSEEQARATAELQQKYEADKRERELEKRQLELVAQRNARNFFVAVSLLVFVVAIANYGRYRGKRREAQLLDRLARTDALTGLSNRRALMDAIAREQQRVERGAAPFAIVLADVDHFKQVNDRYGHDAGDVVLKQVAAAMRAAARDVDDVARWGGEEFLALLPATSPADAQAAAERMRARIRALAIEAGGQALQVSASFGVSALQAGESVETCIKRADEALYRAKREGRDRVVLFVPQDDAVLAGA